MKLRILTALSLCACQAFVHADELEISLSDKSVDGAYEIFYGNNFNTQISLMHMDVDSVEKANVFDPATYNTEQDGVVTDMAGFGLFANGKQGNIRTHLGGKVFYLDTEHSNDMYGLALGGALDAYVRPNVFFTGEVLYAPDIITGGDFHNYWEVNARASFQVLNNANVYFGYKLIEADFKQLDGDEDTREFFNGLYAGFRFSL